MNQTELLQLMIVNAVKDGVSQALQPIKEELAKIKALNTKILKEQTENSNSLAPENGGFRKISRPPTEALMEVRGESSGRELSSLLVQAAPFRNADGVLPDIDIPISLLLNKKR